MVRFGAFAMVFALSAHGAPLVRLANTQVLAAQVDAAGNIYIAGYLGTGSQSSTYDAFVSKLSADGSKVFYTVKLAGSDFDSISALTTDAAGNAYAFGQTQSSDFPATSGAGSGFAVKIDPNGKVLYATRFDTANQVYGSPGGIAVNAAGEAYVSGYAAGRGFPSGNDAPNTATEPTALFIVKFDATGNMVAGIRGVGGIPVLDAQGNVYTAGTPLAPAPVTAGAYQSDISLRACAGTGQLALGCPYQFVAKVNGALTQVLWGTWLD